MAGPALWPRFAADRLNAALKDTPVVMVVGPRQCGKTTLVRALTEGGRSYVTLDDDTVFAGARTDPTAFIRSFDRVTLDEVQRAPDVLRAIKRSVDQDRRPGRFLLTGSADVLTLPTVSESLAGRMEILTLLPLSRAETSGSKPAFLRHAFAGKVVRAATIVTGGELVKMVCAGGFPEMLRRATSSRRRAWARDYVSALVYRDVRDVADIDHLELMSRLVRVLAHYSGQLANFAQIGGRNDLDDKTTKKYVAILEQLFLVRRVEPWFRNRLKRLIKTPRLHFLDSGVLAVMQGVDVERIRRRRVLFGPLLETFVVGEVLKHTTWLDDQYSISHYRDKDQDEVDLVVENAAGDLIGIEVKAAATVHASDFRGLRKLRAAAGDALRIGLVLYDGDETVPFGDGLFAAPISCLWS